MKLVIDIPDAEYERIQAMDWKNGDRWYSCETIAIHNGTPLPKGHGRLIDADRVVTVSFFNEMYEEWETKQMAIYECINQWTDEGIATRDIIIGADKGGEQR